MANTKIEWTDKTWNPLAGCNDKSEGCRNCYARGMARRLEAMGLAKYKGLTMLQGSHVVWTGKISFDEKALLQPLKWKKPCRIFVNSMSDLFHENVPDEWIDRIFAVMALCPQHTFQVLTKRPERMLKYFANLQTSNRVGREINVIYGSPKLINTEIDHPGWSFTRDGNEWEPLPNVWLGVSDEGNRHERVDILRQVPAAVRFVSAEPLIFNPGKVDLSGLDWVIVGGESGPGARPMEFEWAESIVNQCKAARVACFVKQMGSGLAKRYGWKSAKGGDWHEWPTGLMVREFPESR